MAYNQSQGYVWGPMRKTTLLTTIPADLVHFLVKGVGGAQILKSSLIPGGLTRRRPSLAGWPRINPRGIRLLFGICIQYSV